MGHLHRYCFIAVLCLILLLVAGCFEGPPSTNSQRSSPLDTAYRIDGRAIDLADGESEMEAAPGSSAVMTTAVTGEVASGDLNGDGDMDAAVILVHTPGGSGTFYYVAAAVKTEGRYQGTSAVLLGDRITPVNIGIDNAVIKVNYRDRSPEDPMSMMPYIEKSMLLVVEKGTLKTRSPNDPENHRNGKITFELSRLDETGLYGPTNGKRALSYEFCIPDTQLCRAEVKTIDLSVEFAPGSPGRIGCGADQVLCIGSTHQKDFSKVLEKLAKLLYIQRIDECFFE